MIGIKPLALICQEKEPSEKRLKAKVVLEVLKRKDNTSVISKKYDCAQSNFNVECQAIQSFCSFSGKNGRCQDEIPTDCRLIVS
jgi:hypothetical protein